MHFTMEILRRILRVAPMESGQGAAEYSLIILLVAVAIVGAVTMLGPKLGGIFAQMSNAL